MSATISQREVDDSIAYLRQLRADLQGLFRFPPQWEPQWDEKRAAVQMTDFLRSQREAVRRIWDGSSKVFAWDVKAGGEAGEFTGLAAVYGILDLVGDIIEPGAFATAPSKVPLLWNHDHTEVLGLAELEDSPRGLRIRGKLNLAVARAKEVYELIRQGAVRGISIGFSTMRSHFKGDIRHVTAIRLHEISLTSFPAQPLAQVEAVKSAGLAQSRQELSALVERLSSLVARIEAFGDRGAAP